MTRIRTLLAGLFVAGMLLAPNVGHAILEPANDTAPWKWFGGSGDTSLYTSPYGDRYRWGIGDQISSASDVDHIVLACHGKPIQAVGIYGQSNTGDIDLLVYDMAGTLLGSSASGTHTEHVDVRVFAKQAIVIKVYGYNGATGPFSSYVDCP